MKNIQVIPPKGEGLYPAQWKLKQSKLKIIENSAHMIYKEKPYDLYKIFFDFFK